ncbi:MAG: M4 family metallopeptidase [Saprospiraceae bacterium]|nr:M4 family metallopeptidase [Saprospiraceae bacterium]
MKSKKVSLILYLMVCSFSMTIVGQHSTLKPTLISIDRTKSEANKSAQDLLRNYFAPSISIAYKSVSVQSEKAKGLSHEKFVASYNSIPIEYGHYTVHKNQNAIYSISGTPLPDQALSIAPSITPEAGFDIATHHINAKTYLWEIENPDIYYTNYSKPKGELVILPPIPGVSETAHLTYKYFIYSIEPMSAAYYYVDAQSGEIIYENSIICHSNVPATGNAYFDGPVSFDAENYNGSNRLFNTVITSGGIHTVKAINGPSVTTDITSNTTVFTDDIGVQAHWAAEQTVEYFSTVHGRLSYDGNGSKITMVTNIPNYNNAYWTGTTAVFGNGDGTTYDNFASLDIVGHEIAHGVVGTSAGLIYSYESGALNESFADIFGECVEANTQGSNDWLLGEDTKIGSGQAFRSMSNPNTYSHPDTYKGTYWVTGSYDNGGVHFNSGVQNHWFYLLVNGGTGSNDWNNSYSVTGIGKAKAEAIAYRNLTVYLTPTSGYADARTGAIQSAIDLYGNGSAEEIAVTNAWHAVGVGTYYNNPNPLSCTSPNLTLMITFDDRPDLIAWNINDNVTGNFIAAKFVNDYSINQANSTINEPIQISSSGLYRLNFYDLETDGLCCTGGNGSFALMDGNTVVHSGSIFDLSDNIEFCVDVEAGPNRETNRPTVPQNVTVSNITSNSADLNWDASTDDTGLFQYFVFVNGVWQAVPTNSLSLSGLIPNTLYSIDVFAQDQLNNFSVKGQTLTFNTLISTDTAPPSSPTNLMASNITANSFDLSWDAATDNVGVDHYDVFLDGNLYTSTSNLTTALVGLSANTMYDNYVVAVDAAGNTSIASTTLSTTTSNSGPVCASGPLTLTINFDNNPNQVAWELKDKNNQTYAFSSQNDYINQLPGSTISIALPSLSDGDYAFVMYDSKGDGLCCANGNGSYQITDGTAIIVSGSNYDFSKVTQFCVNQTNGDVIDKIPPTTPVLSYSNIGSTTIDLSWTPSTDNETLFGYGFFLNGTYYGWVDYSFSSLTLPGLSPNTTYDLFIVSRDIIGNFSEKSNTITFTTTGGVTSTVIHEGYFETGWDGWIDGGNDCRRMSTQYAAEGAKSVRIRDNSGVASSMTSQDFDLTSYDSVRVEFEYYAQSMENNEDFWLLFEENNTWTNIKSYVKNVDFTSDGFYSGSVLLSASQYAFASNNSFRFQCDASGNGDKIYIDAVVITAYGTSTNFVPLDQPEYDINEFLIFGEPASLSNAPSEEIEPKEVVDIDVYPNPAQHTISLRYDDMDQLQNVALFTIQGQKIMQTSNYKNIDISQLSEGIYYLQVQLKSKEVSTLKFVKTE